MAFGINDAFPEWAIAFPVGEAGQFSPPLAGEGSLEMRTLFGLTSGLGAVAAAIHYFCGHLPEAQYWMVSAIWAAIMENQCASSATEPTNA